MPRAPRDVARQALEIEAAAALSDRETQLDPARAERLLASLLALRAALRVRRRPVPAPP